MARQDDYIRTALRLPPDLHKAVHESADATGKSFNAELIARLQQSFDSKGADVFLTSPLIYLLIDSHGYPQSWDELQTLWRALIQEQGLDVVSYEAVVLTPDMESSNNRAKDAAALAKKLRAGGKSVLLERGTVDGEPPKK